MDEGRGLLNPLAAASCLGHKRELPPLVLQGETSVPWRVLNP